jgi:hypothetical protein
LAGRSKKRPGLNKPWFLAQKPNYPLKIKYQDIEMTPIAINNEQYNYVFSTYRVNCHKSNIRPSGKTRHRTICGLLENIYVKGLKSRIMLINHTSHCAIYEQRKPLLSA